MYLTSINTFSGNYLPPKDMLNTKYHLVDVCVSENTACAKGIGNAQSDSCASRQNCMRTVFYPAQIKCNRISLAKIANKDSQLPETTRSSGRICTRLACGASLQITPAAKRLSGRRTRKVRRRMFVTQWQVECGWPVCSGASSAENSRIVDHRSKIKTRAYR